MSFLFQIHSCTRATFALIFILWIFWTLGIERLIQLSMLLCYFCSKNWVSYYSIMFLVLSTPSGWVPIRMSIKFSWVPSIVIVVFLLRLIVYIPTLMRFLSSNNWKFTVIFIATLIHYSISKLISFFINLFYNSIYFTSHFSYSFKYYIISKN